MTFSNILIFHIVVATLGLLAGAGALFSVKGSPVHRKSGKLFTFAMVLIVKPLQQHENNQVRIIA